MASLTKQHFKAIALVLSTFPDGKPIDKDRLIRILAHQLGRIQSVI